MSQRKPKFNNDFGHSLVQSSKLHTTSTNLSIDWRNALQRPPRIVSNPGNPNIDVRVPQKPKNSHTAQVDNECQPSLASTLPSVRELPPERLAMSLHPTNTKRSQDRSINLAQPRNPNSLYNNLLFLINQRRPTTPLPSLVDYHGKYPQYQSTRSYNLLLDLSLRHQLYGTTNLLFRSIERYRIQRNAETHRLTIQSLVQQGLWDEAWVYLGGLLERGVLPVDESGRSVIPFPLWVTFFRISTACQKPLGKGDQPNIETEETVKTLQERYHFLQSVRPTLMPPLSRTHPFAIYCLVDFLLKAHQSVAATDLTKAYFTALPRPVSPKTVFGCLKIIHVLMRQKVKPGLEGYYDARKRLFGFLKLHPSLVPHPKTLLILFNILRKAQRCGTVAWKDLNRFKSEFGPGVASRRVLLCVSRLALKQRRFDIAKTTKNQMQTVKSQPRPSGHCRQPHRFIYPGHGRLAWRVHRHQARVRRRVAKSSRLQTGV